MIDANVFATQSQWRMGTGPGSFEVPVTSNEKQLAVQVLQERARAEAAEAEVSIQRDAAIHYHEQWLAAEAEAARLRAQAAAMEHATCSCCDRPVNRRIDAVVCDYCYEDKLQ